MSTKNCLRFENFSSYVKKVNNKQFCLFVAAFAFPSMYVKTKVEHGLCRWQLAIFFPQ